MAAELWPRDFAASPGITQCWDFQRERPKLKKIYRQGRRCWGTYLPSLKMAARQRALSGHMICPAAKGTSPRVRAAPRLRGAEGRGAAASAAAGTR